jgi:hypothetical protein
MKNWTVMLYMVGDNNLSVDFIWSILEICRVCEGYDFKDFDIIIQFDPSARGFRPKRYVVEELIQELKTGKPLDELGEEIKGEFAAQKGIIRDFIVDSIKKYPATHQLLVLGGHGNGALGGALLDENPTDEIVVPKRGKKILKDNITAEGIFVAVKLALEELKKSAQKKKVEFVDKIDVFGLDCCVMNSVEIGAAFANRVNYFVSAEGLEPKAGWPYGDVIQALIAEGDMAPDKLAKTIVKKHTNYYENFLMAGLSTDMAACDLNGSVKLREKIDLLAKTLIKYLKSTQLQDALVLAHWKAQSYNFEKFVDLWDICNLLESHCQDTFSGAAQVRKVCAQIKSILEKSYVLKSCRTGPAFQHSHGVSIYFPWSPSEEELQHYNRLFFSRENDWAKFVRLYAQVTQREPRPGTGIVKPPFIVPPHSKAAGAGTGSGDARLFPDIPNNRLFPDIPNNRLIPDVPNNRLIPDVPNNRGVIPSEPNSRFIPDIPINRLIPDVPNNKGAQLAAEVKNMPLIFQRDDC